MIELKNTIVSDDIVDEHFICDLAKCKGACCVEGDLGAPLEKDELSLIDENLELVKPYMSKDGLSVLEKDGAYLLDEEGDFSTTTVNGKECSFAVYDQSGILKCSIEQAWIDKKIDFRKPIFNIDEVFFVGQSTFNALPFAEATENNARWFPRWLFR